MTLILRLKEKVVVKKLWMRWVVCSERKWLSEEKVHERKFLLRDLLCSGPVQPELWVVRYLISAC